MKSFEQEYDEDENNEYEFITIRSREKIEEYMTNRDRSKFLINF